jgi:SAM-dependent methyltransferase
MNDDPFAFAGTEADDRRIQQPLARYFGRGDVVADLGCGRGVFLQLLRQRGATGIGVDTSSQAVEACRAKGFVIEQNDALRFLATRGGDLDGVFASHIIEHLPVDQAATFGPLAHGALKPGGYVVLVTPNPADVRVITETFWLDSSHVRPYPLPLLERWFEAAGFEVVEAYTSSGLPMRARAMRHTVRNYVAKLLLGRHYWSANSVIVGRKR